MSSYPPSWGPYFWKIIHISARRLDLYSTSDAISAAKGEPMAFAERRAILHKFLADTPEFLPCDNCEKHAQMFLIQYPIPPLNPPQEDAKTFFYYTIDFHNHANQITGKRIVTYKEAEANFQPSYTEDQKLSEYQLARMQDSTRIKLLEGEIESMKLHGPPCKPTLNYTPLIAASILAAFFALLSLVMFLRR